MTKYRMKDGTVLNTEKARKRWDEETEFDGHNQISKATGSQWEHETLYESNKGRYYIESDSDWQGSVSSASLISEEEAVKWLLVNERRVPEKLKHLVEEIEE
jgi:hypothetical protein